MYTTAEHFCFYTAVWNLEFEDQNYQVKIQQVSFPCNQLWGLCVSVKHGSQISFEKEWLDQKSNPASMKSSDNTVFIHWGTLWLSLTEFCGR